jgi:putative sterol carrier protein
MEAPKTAREIILSLEQRFNSEKVDEDLDIIFHFDISGERGGLFTAHIEDDACKVSEGLTGEAKCIITCTDQVYEDLELGKTNAQMAFMMGKIKISNIMAMMKFIEYFDKSK